ncbi:MAG: hypothetical protein QXJ28_02050 [Candidatus Pacearchaeota archaeon]
MKREYLVYLVFIGIIFFMIIYFLYSYYDVKNDSEMNREICELNDGNWNECSSLCQEINLQSGKIEFCTEMCKPACICKEEDNRCPKGYRCIKTKNKTEIKDSCERING